MACTYTVVVYGTDPKQLPLITTAALDEVDRIDALMSNYKPESSAVADKPRSRPASAFWSNPSYFASWSVAFVTASNLKEPLT